MRGVEAVGVGLGAVAAGDAGRTRAERLCVADHDDDLARLWAPTDPRIAVAVVEGEVVRLLGDVARRRIADGAQLRKSVAERPRVGGHRLEYCILACLIPGVTERDHREAEGRSNGQRTGRQPVAARLR